MYGLAVNLIVSVSGHPWIIDEIWISIGSLYDEGIDRDIRHNMENMITWETVTPRVGQMFYLNSNRLSIRSLDFSNF